MRLQETRLTRETVFRGTVVNLYVDQVEIGDGTRHRREVVEHPGGVCVAALTEGSELLLVRQFRYAPGEVLLELPAGKLEPGEAPLAAGARELREETGAEGTGYQSLGRMYATPGYDTEVIHLFACRVRQRGAQQLDEGELLDVCTLPLREAEAMVLRGEIPDGKTQIGILKTAALVRQGLL